jgi:hypothetical protein
LHEGTTKVDLMIGFHRGLNWTKEFFLRRLSFKKKMLKFPVHSDEASPSMISPSGGVDPAMRH